MREKGDIEMPVQYVTDDAGNPTAVVIPIDEWDALLNKVYSVEPPRDDTEYLLQSNEKEIARSKSKEWR